MKIPWLPTVAGAAVIGTVIRAAFFTPLEARQGAAQKIFYIHVPAAWVAFLAFGLVAVASGVYLWLRDRRLDRFAESSAEVGVVFTTVVLITGPLWAKPIWGTWWAWWDVRLISTLFLWFIYVAYLVLRDAVESPELRARYSAVLGILGALLIPFVHLSVYMFATMHPRPIIGKPDAPSLPNEMLLTFLIAMVSFTLLYVALVRSRYRYAVERDAAAANADHDA
ncbi:MAG TPA: cytochrome c biogenesis protein CcsA [Gemmatimonadaceae bacterium]|jgi:heme exporter protein C|nr:cytochrome c biogenesis protein CcsA [Gemmatimonadaceae bacterium]